ncbi:MAG: acylphosphatase [Bacteroidales bacterium]
MKQALAITIKGRVQGVGFRFSTVREAERLGITGFVENRMNGTVYIEAEGEPEALNKLVNWCWKGPATAGVENVITQEIPVQNFKRFRVK